MKTFSFRRLSIAIAAVLISVQNLISQAPPVTSVGVATFSAGTWSVPVTVTGFTNVADISLKLNYDPLVFSYTGVTVNSGLLPANTVTTPVTDQSGVFSLSYTSSSAIVLASPANTLLTISFTTKAGIDGMQTLLTWSAHQGDCDMAPPAPAVFTPQINSSNLATYFINGLINIPPVPGITGPDPACVGTSGNVYFTEAGMNAYSWSVSAGGLITAGAGTSSITVTWNNAGSQSVSVTYTDPLAGPATAPTIFPVTVHACGVVNLKLFLEGLYAGAGAMRKAQGAAGNQFPGTVADVITVELHDAVTYATIVHTVTNVNLNTDGTVTFTVPPALNLSYYITIKHRNSIRTVSAAPVSFATGTVNYDFTTLASKAFGNNMKNSGGIFLFYSGDTNQDGFIGILDMSGVDNKSAIFASGYLVEDVNGDGFVGVTDMTIIDNNSAAFVSAINP